GSLDVTYCYGNNAGSVDSPLFWLWQVNATGAPFVIDFDVAGGVEVFQSASDPFFYDALVITWFDDLGTQDTIVLNAGQAIEDEAAYEVWSRGALTVTPAAGATLVAVEVAVLSDSTVSCESAGLPDEPVQVFDLQMTSCNATEVTVYDTFSAFVADIGGCYQVFDFNDITDGTVEPIVGDGFRVEGDNAQGILLSVENAPYPTTFAEGDGTPALDPQLPLNYVSNSRLKVMFEPGPASAIGMTFIDAGDIDGIVGVEAYRRGELVYFLDDFGVGTETNNNIAWRGLIFDQPVDTVVFSMLQPADHFNLDNLVVVPQADLDDDGVPDLCDCAPTTANIAGSFTEVCDDQVDNNCDGFTDGEDPTCGGAGSASCATYAEETLDQVSGGWLVFGDTAWNWSDTLGLWRASSANNLTATLETQPLLIPESACPGDFKVDMGLGGVIATDGDALAITFSKNGGPYAALVTRTGQLSAETINLTGLVAPGDAVSFRLSYVTDTSGFAGGPTITDLRLYSDQDDDNDDVCDACDCAPMNGDYGLDCDADNDGYCAADTGPLNGNPRYAGCDEEFVSGNPQEGGSDCHDDSPTSNPGRTSEAPFCDDGLNNDCDDATDGDDSDCAVADCIDVDNDGYGVGASCQGSDCDDAVESCTDDCSDADNDAIADCSPADTCFDVDRDGYGIGDGCLGADCDDDEGRCALDCATDVDSDNIPDCGEDCADADGDNYGSGPGCTAPDCDDQSTMCTTVCVDVDMDGRFDCKDTCLDTDRDGYGVGAGCVAPDCRDDVGTCTTDCSDGNNNQIPDCAENCDDGDGDGYGNGTSCIAPDCDDTVGACTTSCVDSDDDGTFDCDPADTCIDKDGDGRGVGAGCIGSDCDDTLAACGAVCVDTDMDGRFDCDPADTCLDLDRDNFGVGDGCIGPDCNDAIVTCAMDCTTDADNDQTPDCEQACIDADGDDYGVGPGCLGMDCDDSAGTCTVMSDCVDTDGDQVFDCKDSCLDGDDDGYGVGSGCVANDCDDMRSACTTDCSDANQNGTPDCAEDCVDNDGDGYGVGSTCLGPDCDDSSASCTQDCTDIDTDSLFDCKDPCVDVDRDGYGVGAGCVSADCDDTLNACTSDCSDTNNNSIPDCNEGCVDLDQDGFGQGADCGQIDCYDSSPLCTDNCTHADSDGIPDCADNDDDGDGLDDIDEGPNNTNPLNPDTDGDGLKDGAEVNVHDTDPTNADTDEDGLEDGEEVFLHATDPKVADSDNGGVNDGTEILQGTNPNDPTDDRGGQVQGNGCASAGGPFPGAFLLLIGALLLGWRRHTRVWGA
ncbi:MAG: hypothetical protein ACI9MR_001010, partial [Myxococcota bacterium]